MFEQQIRKSFQESYPITIFTLFGFARGQVVECLDGWFRIRFDANGSLVNVYYEDVMLLEEHNLH